MPFVIYGMEMIKTKWAHLPNAVHIDRVIASAKAHPGHWNTAANTAWIVELDSTHDTTRNAAWEAAWEAAHCTITSQERQESRDAAWVTAYSAWKPSTHDAWKYLAWMGVVCGAIRALVAYDDCAYMLDSDPGELAIVAKLGDPRAVLLLYACKVFHSLKELE